MSESSSKEKCCEYGAKDLTEIFKDIHTGDIVLMNRRCLRMKNKLSQFLCLLHKTENRFDHAAMIVKISAEELKRHSNIVHTIASCACTKENEVLSSSKESLLDKEISVISPSNTYILETNVKGVTLRPAEARVNRSSANEIVIRSLSTEATFREILQHEMLNEIDKIVDVPYQTNIFSIFPSCFTPPDKLDRINAAHKLNEVEKEIDIRERMSELSPSQHSDFIKEIEILERAKEFLITNYFPHLKLSLHHETGKVQVDMSEGHFIIDGRNNAEKMVCSELICNLWHRTKLTTGYVPASGIRPFDFFDNSWFNFTHKHTCWNKIQTCKSTEFVHRWLPDANKYIVPSNNYSSAKRRDEVENSISSQVSEQKVVDNLTSCRNNSSGSSSNKNINEESNHFYERGTATLSSNILHDEINKIFNRKSVFSDNIADNKINTTYCEKYSNIHWLVQSNLYGDTLIELPSRLFWSSALFASCSLLCAPLTFSWMQRQLATTLLRGSMWELSYMIWARDICFAAAQSLTAYLIVKYMRIDQNEITGSRSISSLVDTRHVYYTLLPILCISSLTAHVMTTPLMNLIITYHFAIPWKSIGTWSKLMSTSLTLAPVNLLLPFQAYWLLWYETIGSFIVPTPSSILRPRADLLELPQWNHWRNDALIGAVIGISLIDFALYPFTTFVRRKNLLRVNASVNKKVSWKGLYRGYGSRLAGNILITASTLGILKVMHKI